MAIKSSRLFKIIALALCFSLVFEQGGFAQMAGELDLSSRFARLTSSFTQVNFRPVHLRYLSYDNQNNNFKLLLDKGSQGQSYAGTVLEENFKPETKTLLNYFFIGISLPNESFWVNLRPDAADNIIDPEVEKTDLGKILLEADLQLKKDTANFTSPQTAEGKEYWSKLYKKAGELFGSENITIPTLTRPWIVPGEIIIRETPDNAYIYKATLKVMLEQDYLKGSATYNFQDTRLKALNEYSSQLIRELIIPKLTKDVNTAKRYAPLRQVYYSLILAQWFKQKFYGKGGLYSHLINQKKLTGLTSQEPWSKTTYFQAYQKSFQEGEYNIKEQVYSLGAQTIRNYMSGGIAIGGNAIGDAIKASGGGIAGSPLRKIERILNLNEIVSGKLTGGTTQEPFLGEISFDSGSRAGLKNIDLNSDPAVYQARTALKGIIQNKEGELGLEPFVVDIRRDQMSLKNEYASFSNRVMAVTDPVFFTNRSIQESFSKCIREVLRNAFDQGTEIRVSFGIDKSGPNKILEVKIGNPRQELRLPDGFGFGGQGLGLILVRETMAQAGGTYSRVTQNGLTVASLRIPLNNLQWQESIGSSPVVSQESRVFNESAKPAELLSALESKLKDVLEDDFRLNWEEVLATLLLEMDSIGFDFDESFSRAYKETTEDEYKNIGEYFDFDKERNIKRRVIRQDLKDAARVVMSNEDLQQYFGAAGFRKVIRTAQKRSPEGLQLVLPGSRDMKGGRLLHGKTIFDLGTGPNAMRYMNKIKLSPDNQYIFVTKTRLVKAYLDEAKKFFAVGENLNILQEDMFKLAASKSFNAIISASKGIDVIRIANMGYYVRREKIDPEWFEFISSKVKQGGSVILEYKNTGEKLSSTYNGQLIVIPFWNKVIDKGWFYEEGAFGDQGILRNNRVAAGELMATVFIKPAVSSSPVTKEVAESRLNLQKNYRSAQDLQELMDGAGVPFEVVNFVQEVINLKSEAYVADLGPGLGIMLNQLKATYGDKLHAYGVDLKDASGVPIKQILDQLKAEEPGSSIDASLLFRRFDLTLGDMASVRFEHPMDLITSFFAAQYSADPLGAFVNAFNQLAPAGNIVFHMLLPYDNSEATIKNIDDFVSSLQGLGVDINQYSYKDAWQKELGQRHIFLRGKRKNNELIQFKYDRKSYQDVLVRKSFGSTDQMSIKLVIYEKPVISATYTDEVKLPLGKGSSPMEEKTPPIKLGVDDIKVLGNLRDLLNTLLKQLNALDANNLEKEIDAGKYSEAGKTVIELKAFLENENNPALNSLFLVFRKLGEPNSGYDIDLTNHLVSLTFSGSQSIITKFARKYTFDQIVEVTKARDIVNKILELKEILTQEAVINNEKGVYPDIPYLSSLVASLNSGSSPVGIKKAVNISEANAYGLSKSEIDLCVRDFESSMQQVVASLRGINDNEKRYLAFEKSFLEQYDHLIERLSGLLQDKKGGLSFIYPFRGIDFVLARHGKVFDINHDQNDFNRGEVIFRRAFGDGYFKLATENLLISPSVELDAKKIESYTTAIQETSNPRVLVLKDFSGFSGFNEESKRESALALLRLVVNKLDKGDKILVLFKKDLDMIDSFSNTVVEQFHRFTFVEEGMKGLIVPNCVAVFEKMSGDELKPIYRSEINIPEEEIYVSSPVEDKAKGGIDLRSLPIATQQVPVISAANAMRLTPIPMAQLNKEWEEIENMLGAGIVPSTDRIKIYLQSTCLNGSFNQETDKVLSCLAQILRMDEERVTSTDPALKAMLVLLESDKPADEARLSLAKIIVPEKEPKALKE